MRRREFITLLGNIAAAWPLNAQAQHSAGVRRVGVLISYNKEDQEVQDWLAIFHDTLGKLGWTQGQNIKFEYRWANNIKENIKFAMTMA